ncbi:MAG: hypothetical protein ACJAYE_001763 [Candidatus Azotimanducaceae bacterium]|jgi:hypothetical protein
MKARNAFITILILAVTSACSYTGTNLRPYASWTGLIPDQQISRRSHWAIDANAKVYIAQPASGYQDSALVDEMVEVFRKYYPRARLGRQAETLEQAFVSARFAGMDYVVLPYIDSYAEQDGIQKIISKQVEPSNFRLGEARMNVYIYASQGEELVDHLKLDTRGSIFTSDSRKLIWPPLDAYLKSLSQYDLARR